MQPSVNNDTSTVAALLFGEASPPRIQVIDPLSVSDWDAQVTSLSGCSFFHSAAWARTLEESYGYKPVYLARTEGGQIRGLLPMMEVSSWLTGRRGVSLPFTDCCEVLGVQREALIAEASRLGTARGWKYWESRGADGVPAETARYSAFVGHTLELSQNEDSTFSRFDSSVRRAIRKAEKAGVVVELSRGLEDVRTFYALHCQTRQKHGVPPQPFSFFAGFHRNVIAHNLGFVVIARFQGKPIAASVFVHLGSNAIYKYGASDETLQHLRGSNLVMWHAIQWYARAGFTRLHFGRTAKSNLGLRRFKTGWGAGEQAISYLRYDLRKSRFVAGQEESSGPVQSLIRKIPVPVARLLGRVLYRHVA